MTICFIWILPTIHLNHKTPQVLKVLKLNLFMSLKKLWGPSPKDVLSSYHDYDLFLLNQEIDTPSDNLNHHDTHVCENQDDILVHATNLSQTFALPQFMAQHNYEGRKPTDTPSTVPTAIQAPRDQTSNPRCAHNLMEFTFQVLIQLDVDRILTYGTLLDVLW